MLFMDAPLTLQNQPREETDWERLIRKPARPKKPDEMLRTTTTTSMVKSAKHRLQRGAKLPT